MTTKRSIFSGSEKNSPVALNLSSSTSSVPSLKYFFIASSPVSLSPGYLAPVNPAVIANLSGIVD